MPERTTDTVYAFEVERMLLWFKAQLPQHDLGRWLIEQRSMDVDVIEDDGHSRMRPYEHGYVRIEGHGECLRCGRRFDIPKIANFITSPARVGGIVTKAKKWVEGIAERDGPCWGDVPTPDTHDDSSAVFDRA